MGEERVALEDRVHRALLRGQGGHVHAVQNDLSLVRGFQAGDDAQGGGFAAAGRTQQGDKFAAGYIQRDVAQDVALAEVLGNMFQGKKIFFHDLPPGYQPFLQNRPAFHKERCGKNSMIIFDVKRVVKDKFNIKIVRVYCC